MRFFNSAFVLTFDVHNVLLRLFCSLILLEVKIGIFMH